MTDATGAAELRPLQVETNGINVIAETERKGHPRTCSGRGSAPTSPCSA